MFFGGESKHPSLPLARAERKPFDRKRKHPPRHQRADSPDRKLSFTVSPLAQRNHTSLRQR